MSGGYPRRRLGTANIITMIVIILFGVVVAAVVF
jgi:hypothetical protein